MRVLMPRVTSRDCVAKMIAAASGSFADHKIVSEGHGRWYCRGNDFAHWFEAIVLRGGSLYVGGDIDHVVFSNYHKPPSDEAVVRWIGRKRDLDLFGYVLEKASIGMGRSRGADSIVEQIDPGVWLDDAFGYMLNYYEGEPRTATEEELLSASPPWLVELITEVRDGQLDPRTAPVEEHPDWVRAAHETEGEVERWGRVPSQRLVHAFLATRKLVELMDLKEQEAAPQEVVTQSLRRPGSA